MGDAKRSQVPSEAWRNRGTLAHPTKTRDSEVTSELFAYSAFFRGYLVAAKERIDRNKAGQTQSC